ncbi:DNA-binding NarL/FixJ family response regulator [Geodermatophilus bullaregiensis]|uniref:response regulator n=1 Tax=Geodermatophilus bullaregiensis TaxID=1564160 RepID=UPI001956F6B8|nr:response regulator transcription factor [Geodermatophilus bullaregiensis]MBM7808605.1 DNA-binding NarL/FixJ family response regulator [Geodermatophilus bullaregiensis]
MTTTVVIADDQPLMRTALRTCLDAEPDLSVAGVAGDGAEVVRMAARLRPSVVVMDLHMPIMDGIEATRRLVAMAGGTPVRVLVMTSFDLDEHIIDALRAGASGFLVKDATPEELVHAVRVIAAGHAFLSPSITRRLLDLRAGSMPRIASDGADPAVAALTVRERDVLRLVARGLTNLEIATALDLAPSSVKTHIGHLLAKLHVYDRVQLVVFAYEHELIRPGWIEPEDAAPGPGPSAGHHGPHHVDRTTDVPIR